MKFFFEQNFQPSSPSYFSQRPLSTHLQSVIFPALCQTNFHTHTKHVVKFHSIILVYTYAHFCQSV